MIIRLSSVVALLLAFHLLVPAVAAPAATTLMVKAPPVKLEAVASSMPVWFEPNRGQVAGRTEWTTRAAGAWLFLTSNEVVYALPPEIKFDPARTRGVPSFKTTNVHMRMVGGRKIKGVGEGAMGSYSNYFVGKQEGEWFTGVPHFERVRYAAVYPGIDVVYYATGRSVEYDFLVEPGANPRQIELAFSGVDGLRVDRNGDLVVGAGGKEFRQHRPRVFQGSMEIEASYRITELGTVNVDVSEYDPLIPLRVDPVVDFSTYLGGPGEDYLQDIAIAPDNNIILFGSTQSPASPALDPFQQPSIVGLAPILLKMSGDGRRILFYTILGANSWDSASSITVASDGTLFVAGSTRSPNFPLKNPFQSTFTTVFGSSFLARISSDSRTLVFSSYLGGSIQDTIWSIARDANDNVYAAGYTDSPDFPVMTALQTKYGTQSDAFLTKIDKSGRMVFSTYFGGVGRQSFRTIVVRPQGDLVLVGESSTTDYPLKDAIQTTITPRTGYATSTLTILTGDGRDITYSTFLAGDTASGGQAVALDSTGNIYVAGVILDPGLPLKNPFQQGLGGGLNSYLIKLDSSGKTLLYSSYVGSMEVSDLKIDATDHVYLTGSANHSDIVLKGSPNPFRGGSVYNSDAVVMRFSPDARTLDYSVILGGGSGEHAVGIAFNSEGHAFIAGTTGSVDFSVKNSYQRLFGGGFDGFVAKIVPETIQSMSPILVSPLRMVFSYTIGGPTSGAQTLRVSDSVQRIQATVSDTWLRVGESLINGPGSLSVAVSPAGLSPGVYDGEVRLSASGFAPTNVRVTLNILAAAPSLQSASPAFVQVGSNDTQIVLRGAGFSATTTLIIDGVLWTLRPVEFISAIELKTTLPRSYFAADGNIAIAVRNPNSAVSAVVNVAVGRPAPHITQGGVLNAASYRGGSFSPGEIVTVFGTNFGNAENSRVLFDSIPVSPLYLLPNQFSVVIPYSRAGASGTSLTIESGGQRSVPYVLPLVAAAPAVFTSDGTGKGLAAALNQDGSINSLSNPAERGSIVVLFGTGGGLLTNEPLGRLESPTTAFVDGIEAELLYAGTAPGLTIGALQFNIKIPNEATTGEVIIRVGDTESQGHVTVSLR